MKTPKSKSFELDVKPEKLGIDEKVDHEKSDLKGDYTNVVILLFLYMLQGIPLGISYSVPILLQNRGITYAEQAGFTFAFYPFTMKILWAPFVDSVYVRSFGRRKSWLVPTQLLIGTFMLYIGHNVDEWMGDGGEKRPQMVILTTMFFILWFLTATQDIAVDGWALTMLQRKNVGYAATCNAVGIMAGFFTGYTVFLILDSEELRFHGFSLPNFLRFWGVVFIITTIFIAIFKRDISNDDEELENNPDYGVKKAYPMLLKIIKLKPVIKFSLVLVTARACFSAADEITTLKLIEAGVPKDKLGYLSIPQLPLQLLIPFMIARFTTGPKPMSFYLKAFPFRLLMTLVIASFVYATPTMIGGRGSDIPTYYYVIFILVFMFRELFYWSMGVSDTAFMAKISDPLVGGTYMTLLNTVGNFGSRWFKTFFLWLVDYITWKSCVYDSPSNSTILLTNNQCENLVAKTECIGSGGRCQIDIDGYYIEIAFNFIYGIFWYQWGKRTILYLQSLNVKDWHVLAIKPVDDENPETAPLKEIKNKD